MSLSVSVKDTHIDVRGSLIDVPIRSGCAEDTMDDSRRIIEEQA